MTDEELQTALLNRGIEPTGSKEDMINKMTQIDHSK